MHIQPDGAIAEEPVEGPLRAADPLQLAGEVVARDDHRALLAHGGESADVVPMRVGEDDVPNRGTGDLAQRLDRAGGALGSRAGVDGDDARWIDEEGDVPEIEPLGDVHVFGFLHELRVGEAESCLGPDGEVAGYARSFDVIGSRAPEHLPRSRLVAQRPVGLRQAAVDGAVEIARKAVADRERRVQIGQGLL